MEKWGEEHAGENVPHLHREDKTNLYLTEEMTFQGFVDWLKGNSKKAIFEQLPSPMGVLTFRVDRSVDTCPKGDQNEHAEESFHLVYGYLLPARGLGGIHSRCGIHAVADGHLCPGCRRIPVYRKVAAAYANTTSRREVVLIQAHGWRAARSYLPPIFPML